ncbi:hypothetical protein [Corynebacterium lubricantis]|uniref:hypothetical protein n=1 Tax=Corynebacterium lubricantis TaxID=541095 RepID=UPI0003710E2F|nr:hypothetical protein [Corynebacterium lubricantis]
MKTAVFAQRLNGGMRIVLIAIAALLIGGAIYRWLAAPAIVEVAIFLVLAVVALLLLFVKITVRVHQGGVDIHFSGGLFDEQVPASAITGVSAGPTTKLSDGAGKRHIEGATAFIVGGPTVRIEHGADELGAPQSTLVSVKDPDEAIAAIEALIARTQSH